MNVRPYACLLLLAPAAASARQYSTQLEYTAVILYSRTGDVLSADMDDIKSFDCSQADGYVTFFEGRLQVKALGGYELEVHNTRVFGRKQPGTAANEGANVSVPDDDNDCKAKGGSCGHEHLLGNYFLGKNCFNELRLPGRPAHSTADTKTGEDFMALVGGGDKAGKIAEAVVSVALLQYTGSNRSAPTKADFDAVFAASQDSLLKGFVDPAFMRRFAQYDKERRCAVDNDAAKADGICGSGPGQ